MNLKIKMKFSLEYLKSLFYFKFFHDLNAKNILLNLILDSARSEHDPTEISKDLDLAFQ